MHRSLLPLPIHNKKPTCERQGPGTTSPKAFCVENEKVSRVGKVPRKSSAVE